MTEHDRSEAMRLVGWLKGFSTSVRMMTAIQGQNGSGVVIADEALDEYDSTIERLVELLEGEPHEAAR